MTGDQRPGGGTPEPEPHEPEHSEPEHEPEQPEKSEPGPSHGSGMRAVIAALGANIGIAVVKFAAFLVTGSASMLAGSVPSVADSGNQALLLLGRSRAQRAETEEHQFGFGSERYFYGFVVAVVLFTVGAVFSVYEGVAPGGGAGKPRQADHPLHPARQGPGGPRRPARGLRRADRAGVRPLRG